jgi:hypothetical protein
MCSQCSSGFVLYQGLCMGSCPAATYQNGSGCVGCDGSCGACNATNCTLCAANFNFILEQKCYVSCPTNYSASGSYCIKNTPPVNPPVDPKPPVDPNTNNTNSTPTPNPSANNSSVIKTKSGPIVDQVVVVEGDHIFVSMYFNNNDLLDVNISVNLVNKDGQALPLSGSVNKSNNMAYFSARLPEGQDLTSYSLVQTNADSPNGNSTLVSAQPSSQLQLKGMAADALANLKVFGYIFSTIMLLFIVLSKIKGHFTAEEANSIILHSFNFAQVCYLFKFSAPL